MFVSRGEEDFVAITGGETFLELLLSCFPISSARLKFLFDLVLLTGGVEIDLLDKSSTILAIVGLTDSDQQPW